MAINFNDNIRVNVNRPTDFRFGPFSSIVQANSLIPISQRYHGLIFGVYTTPLDIVISDIDFYYYYNDLSDLEYLPFGTVTKAELDAGLLLKENTANKQDSLAIDSLGIKFPTVDAVNVGLALKANVSGQVFTGAISATNLSNINTGDETLATIQSKRPLKTIEGQSLEGAGNINLDKADVELSNVDNTSDLAKPISTATQTALDLKLTKNTAIVPATKTKITYDVNGLITNGADATTADIEEHSDRRYLSDTQKVEATQSATSTLRGLLSSADWVTFNEKEEAITAGTTNQYYRGDKIFQTLNTAAVPDTLNLRYVTDAERIAITHSNRASLDLVFGTNTGDQFSIVGITGTIAQFNTALTDDDFATVSGLNSYQLLSEKGANNGYSPLDSGGKIPLSHLPSTLLKYQGVWNASTNTPTLTNPDATKVGNVYNVSVAGTQFDITWSLGDWLIYNASGVVEKSDNSDDVVSVNGQTGQVVLNTSHIAEVTNLYYTEARVNANSNVSANTAARHNAVTIGTGNGLSLSTQALSLGLASTSATGALTSTDWSTFNNKLSTDGSAASLTSFPTLNQNTTGTATNVTGIVAIANGGTGSSTKNFLDLTTDQSFTGIKSAVNTGGGQINGLDLTNNGHGGQVLSVNNSSSGLGIYCFNSGTAGIFADNTSSGNGIVSNNSSSGTGIFSNNNSNGVGIQSLNNLTGNGIVSNGSPTATGFNFVGQNNGANTFTVNKFGVVTAPTFIGALTGNATNVTGIVAIANGGTGSSTKNFIDLTTDQSFTGIKSSINNAAGQVNGLVLTNNGTGGQILSISNTANGQGLRSNNSSTGRGIFSDNTSTGIGIYSNNFSTGQGLRSDNFSTGQGIYSDNTSTGIGIFSDNTSAGIGINSNNSSTGQGLRSENNSTGEGIYSNNNSTGNGIVSNGSTNATGFNYVGQNNGTNTFTVDKFGVVTAPTFTGALIGIASGNLTGTGTVNQLAKFTASGVVGNSNAEESNGILKLNNTIGITAYLLNSNGINKAIIGLEPAIHGGSENDLSIYSRSGGILFYTNNVEKARILSNGNVGIGTVSPNKNGFTNALTINSANVTGLELTVSDINKGFLGFNGSTNNMTLSNVVAGDLIFNTTNTERVRILANGNVGIGTTSPSTVTEINKNFASGSTQTDFLRLTASQGGAWFSQVGLQFRWNDFGNNAAWNLAQIMGRVEAWSFSSETSGGGLEFYTKTSGTSYATSPTVKMVITNNGNVGIGTINPTERLDVVGNGKFSGSVTAPTFNGSESTFTNSSSAYGITRITNTVNGGEASISYGNTSDTNEQRWTIGKNIGNNGLGDFGFYTNGSEKLKISNVGDVTLIGTLRLNRANAGSNTYHELNRNAITTENMFVWQTANNPRWYLGQRSKNSEDGFSLFNVQINDDVLYFNAAGAATFARSITGTSASFTTSSTLIASFRNTDATNGYGVAIESEGTSATRYALTVRNLAASQTYFHISTVTGSVGNVGIGTTAPSSKLEVAGNGRFRGSVTATDFITSSDRRLKSNIVKIENGLDMLSKFTSYEYIKDGKQNAGFIAQEVMTVLPYAVFDTGSDKMLRMNDRPILAYMHKAIIELKEKNEKLEKEIAKLKLN